MARSFYIHIMNWNDEMATLLDACMSELGSESTTYSRSGFTAFTVRGISERDPHLESQERGPFTSINYTLVDFNEATPFHAFITVTISNIPANGGEIVIDGATYTFRTTLTQETANEVLRGANATEAAVNLTSAINATVADAGTLFSTETAAHETCSATSNANVVTVSYLEAGTVGDNKVATESIFGTSLRSKLFSGGGPLIADEITLADGITYRIGDDGIGYDGQGGVKLRLFPKYK